MGKKGAEDVAVIGGGLAGMKAALDLAKLGRKVTLVEGTASIGGKPLRDMKDYKFPKRDATLDYIDTVMMDVEWNKNIKTLTLTTVKGVTRDEKAKTYKLKLFSKARHVYDVCTSCQMCVDPCPVTVPNEYSDGVGTRKAVFLPNFYASPRLYVIDEKTCLWYKDKSCRRCEEVCPVDAIRFDADQKDTETEITVDAVVVTTGAKQLPLEDFPQFGAGKLPWIATLQQINRLLDPGGPTLGELRLPPSGRLADVKQLLVGNYHSLEVRSETVRVAGVRPSSLALLQVKEGASAWPENGRVTLRWMIDAAKSAAADNPSLKIHIFYDKDAAATLKGQLIGLQKQLGVQMVEGLPFAVEGKGDKAVVKWQAPDGEKALEVGLAVVATPVALADDVKGLVSQLGIKLDEDGFAVPEGRIQVAGPARGPMEIEEVFEDASHAVARLMLALART